MSSKNKYVYSHHIVYDEHWYETEIRMAFRGDRYFKSKMYQ